MALIRLAYAADLPGPGGGAEGACRRGDAAWRPGFGRQGGGRPAAGGGARAVARGASPAAAGPGAGPAQSFEDVVALIDTKRDIGLKLDVERYIRPISFRPGAITFEPAPGAPSNLAHRLVARLKEWTGQPWLVAAEGGGGREPAGAAEARGLRVPRTQIEPDPFIRQVMEAFPGAEIVDVRQPAAAPTEARPAERRRGWRRDEAMKNLGDLMKQAQAMQEKLAGRPAAARRSMVAGPGRRRHGQARAQRRRRTRRAWTSTRA